jgi:hypothetical protein
LVTDFGFGLDAQIRQMIEDQIDDLDQLILTLKPSGNSFGRQRSYKDV